MSSSPGSCWSWPPSEIHLRYACDRVWRSPAILPLRHSHPDTPQHHPLAHGGGGGSAPSLPRVSRRSRQEALPQHVLGCSTLLPTTLGGRGTESTPKLVTGCVQAPPPRARPPLSDAAGRSKSVWSVPPLPNSGTHLVGLPHPTVVSNVLPESAVSVHLDGARGECGLLQPSQTHGPLC